MSKNGDRHATLSGVFGRVSDNCGRVRSIYRERCQRRGEKTGQRAGQ